MHNNLFYTYGYDTYFDGWVRFQNFNSQNLSNTLYIIIILSIYPMNIITESVFLHDRIVTVTTTEVLSTDLTHISDISALTIPTLSGTLLHTGGF